MIRFHIAPLAALLVAGSCLSSWAQDVVPAMPVVVQEITAAHTRVDMTVNGSRILKMDSPIPRAQVGNPELLAFTVLSENEVQVHAKKAGITSVNLWNDKDEVHTVDVIITGDVRELELLLKTQFPTASLKLFPTQASTLVISGYIDRPDYVNTIMQIAEDYYPKVINHMIVGGTQQVMLKVRFAEMQRSVAKNLSSSIALRSTGGDVGVIGESGTWLQGDNDISNSTITPRDSVEGALGLGFTAGNLEFAVLLEALESKGMVRTLAEPNLTALSGQEASFLAGGEYPIPVAGGDGTIGIEYKPFGVQLGFTPVVVDGNIINLTINAAVSAIDSSITIQSEGFSVNAFKVRETATTVEMRDGESFAIAGLLQDDFRDLNGQVPWLGDIPVLGTLFRSADYQRAQSELVIIVTPHLVNPTRGEALALPTDRVRIPTERELFLFGKTAGSNTGAAGEVARQDYSGSYGYVME